MLFKNQLFKVGSRVQIVLQKINLEAGAGDEYPHMGTGTVEIPMREKLIPVVLGESEKPSKASKSKAEAKPRKKTKKDVEIEIKLPEFMKVLEPDMRRQQALLYEGQVFVRLDKFFVRERDPKEFFLRDRVKKHERLTEMPVPYGILRELKPEEDSFLKQS